MAGTAIEIKTADGSAPAQLFRPSGGASGPLPGVLVFMDVIGIRPTMAAMSQRFADAGYAVLLPDLFYRQGPYDPLTPAELFGDEAKRNAMFGRMMSLDGEKIRSDLSAYVETLAKEGAAKIGAVGYCMGGGWALRAAAHFPNRVKAAASFHGGRLATDAPDSPHRLAPEMKEAKVYVGVAGIDDHFTGEEEGRLAEALRDAGVDHTIETYAGAKHGFAVDDTPVYDKAAAERHWSRTLALFEEALK